MKLKLWLDDVREAPIGYVWLKSVNEAKEFIRWCACTNQSIELLSLDHDLGEYADDGGDGYKLLDWLEEYLLCYFPIRIHSQNPVGVENMRRIIERNGWREAR